MKTIKRLTALIMVFGMVIGNTGSIHLSAATAKGTTLRLEQIEGTVTLKNSNDTAKSVKSGMKLYNGDKMSTDKSSYAYISLDGTKAVKVDESSSVSIKQNGTENEVMVNSGSLMFNVTVPLTKKESLNIRTSTMVTGVRGTIGIADRISDEESEIFILEGKVELASIDSKTGKATAVSISAGEKGLCRRIPAKFDNIEIPNVLEQKFSEDDIPDYAVIEIGRNLDIQNRLKQDGVLDVEKILKRYRELGDTGTYITIGTPVTPNTVSTDQAKPVSQNTADKEESSGGGGGGGAGGTANAETAVKISITSATGGGKTYTYGDTITPLVIAATTDVSGAFTTYQWYKADSATANGIEIAGATSSTYTPESEIGTKYYYCVVTSAGSANSTQKATKKSDVMDVTVNKIPTTTTTSKPVEPQDADIGFTSITLDEVALAALNRNPINADGGKISIMGLKHDNSVDEEHLFVRKLDTPVITAPPAATDNRVVEYGKTQIDDPSDEDIDWQESRTFTGLTPGMEYSFYTRVAATDFYEAGPRSARTRISTKNADQYGVVSRTDTNNIEYTFDLAGYDGSVSANAAIDGGGNQGSVTVENLEIPETIKYYDVDVKVTEIKDNAFYNNNNLINVVIPDSVEVIGEFAFGNCINIENIQFGKGLKYIDNSAFASCEKVEKIVLQEGLEGIGTHAFANDSSLKAVFLPSTLQTVSGNENMGSIFYNIPLDMNVYCRVSGDDVSGPKPGWEEYWNKDNDTYEHDTFWYREDADNNEVILYSSESKYVYYNALAQANLAARFNSVYSNYPSNRTEFDEDENNGFCVFEKNANSYIGVIDSDCLKWALENYAKVVIPKGNVAMMDSDVTIQQGKELWIEGDFATEAFNFIYNNDTISLDDLYFAHYHDDKAHNVLKNYGTIRVTGNLYTANMTFNALEGENGSRMSDYMSTIVSEGKIELLDNSEFYIYCAEEGILRDNTNSVTKHTCMDISDITISGNGAILVNTFKSSNDNDYSKSIKKYSETAGINNLTGAFGNNGLFVLQCSQSKTTGAFAIEYDFVKGSHDFINGNTSQAISVLDVLTFKQGNIENYIYAHSIP